MGTPEIIAEHGTTILVKHDGRISQVPNTDKRRVVLKSDILEGCGWKTLSDSPRVELKVENSGKVTEIKFGEDNPPVSIPHSEQDSLFRGLAGYVENNDLSLLKQTYKDRLDQYQIRPSKARYISSLYDEVEVCSDGLEIRDTFLLDWTGDVNLLGVERSECYLPYASTVEDGSTFMELSVDSQSVGPIQVQKDTPTRKYDTRKKESCPNCEGEEVLIYSDEEVRECTKCSESWTNVELSEEEQKLVAKVEWLVNYRSESEAGDAYWSVIEEASGRELE